MADSSKLKKYGKIAIVIVVVILVIYLVYRFFSKGNAYASKSTLDLLKKGSYGSWKEWPDDSVRTAFVTAANGIDNTKFPGQNFTNGEVYAAAWMKGMNIEPNASNLRTFGDDIRKYISNTGLRAPHWEVTVGAFLNP